MAIIGRAVRGRHDGRHPHGTRAAYVADRCRCPDCTSANTRWNRRRTRAIVMSRWAPYVDAAPVRAHLLLLRQTGMGIDKIVRQSGISRSTVQRLFAAKPASDHRRPPRIRPDVATRLMAVTAASESSGPLIDAAATQQRFQELSEAGFGLREIARRIGRDPASLSRSVRRASTVTARTAIAIEQVHHDLLADKPGHSGC